MDQRDPQRRNPGSARDPGETAELPSQGSRRAAAGEHDKDKPKTSPPPDPKPGTTPEPADAAPPSDDVLNIIADVESQLERIRSFQHGHEEQLKSLSERSEALSKAERDLNEAAQSIAAQEQKLQEQRRELEARAETAAKQHEEQVEQLKQARAELKNAETELAERSGQLETQSKQVRETQAGFDRQRAELDKQKQDLESRSKQQAQEAQARSAELKRAQAELGTAREQIESLKQQLETQREAGQRQTEALQERAAKAEANVGELIAQVEQVGSELEKARVEIKDATARSEETARKLQQRETQLGETQKKLELTSGKLAEFAKVVSGQTPQLEKLATAMAEIEQQKQMIRKLQEQLAQAKKDFEAVTAQIQAMREQTADGSAADVAAEMERLRVHAAELEKELFKVRSESEQALKAAQESAAAAPVKGGGSETAQRELREKAQRIKIAAKHLQARKLRLERYHQALRRARRTVAEQCSPPAGAATAADAATTHDEYEGRMRQNAQVQQQREELRQLQAMLAVSEQDMIRKWARPKAVITMTGLLIWAVIIAVTSWFAADHFFPAKRAVTVTIQAEPRPGQQLTEQDLDQWRQWHTVMLNESAFHAAVAKRMESRHLDRYAKPEAVAGRIQDAVRIESPQPRQLAFTMAGTDTSDMTSFLDTMATTLAAESGRHLAKRTDGAKAQLIGEQRSGNAVSYAAINPVPLVDERLKYGGIIFAAAFTLTLIVGITIYARLLRAKRLFDDDGAGASEQS